MTLLEKLARFENSATQLTAQELPALIRAMRVLVEGMGAHIEIASGYRDSEGRNLAGYGLIVEMAEEALTEAAGEFGS